MHRMENLRDVKHSIHPTVRVFLYSITGSSTKSVAPR